MLPILFFMVVVGLVNCQNNETDVEETLSRNRGNLPCKCVPYYQCKDGEIITDGSGLIDPRKNSPSQEELPLDGKRIPPHCGDMYTCCRTPGTVTEQPYVHACGIRRPNGVDSRISSTGQDGETEFGEFPWQGAVLNEENGRTIFKCACVLIDRRYALTVAHCVDEFVGKDQIPFFVRFGVWNTQKSEEDLPHQSASITSVTIHQNYNGENLKNDIAVLKFREPITYAPNVDTICLPRFNENRTGNHCIVTGWGKDAWDDGKFSRVLRKVSVPVLSHNACQDRLRKTRLGEFYVLDSSFICAGGVKDQDACKGDGGGPLACYRRDGVYTLTGLVSFGVGCGKENVPGAYTDVAHFLTWISDTTEKPISDFWPKL